MPKVINAMKYFCANAPQYHIACAVSLLGIALAKPSSFPAGKVNFMQIDPMTFTEFLLANGDENVAKYLESADAIEPIPDAFFNPLYESLRPTSPAEASRSSKSCSRIRSRLRVRFSLDNLKLDDDVLNIPLLQTRRIG